MASHRIGFVEHIRLDMNKFSGLPPNTEIHITQRLSSPGLLVATPSIGAVIELDAWDKAQAMAELVDKLWALSTSRLKIPLRAGRHDRGWPKVAPHG